MPYLQKTKSKKQWRAQTIINGRRYNKLFSDDSDKSYQAALLWENQIKKEYNTHGDLINIDFWFSMHRDYIKDTVEEKTYLRKKSVKRRFLLFSGNIPIYDLNRFMVKKYINLQKKSRTGSAVNEDIKELRSIWNWAVDSIENFPESANPFQRHSKLSEKKHPHVVPAVSNFWAVYSAASDIQEKAILLTIFYTAARPIEVFRLKLSDINLETMMLRLWSKKGKNHDLMPRWVIIKPELLFILKKWLKKRSSNNPGNNQLLFYSLFNNNFGNCFRNRHSLIKKLCKKANVEIFGLYGLRHLRARIEYSKGKSVKDIQILLGHARPSTTDFYLAVHGLDGLDDSINDDPPDDFFD